MTDDQTCVLEHRTDPDRPRRAWVGFLCRGHVDGLYRTLTELATFAGQADEASYDETVSIGYSQPTTGTKDKPLPCNERRIDHVIAVRGVLASWCQLVAEERGVAVPDSPEPAVTSGFLRRHLDWACGQAWTDEFAVEVFELGRRAFSLLNPSGVRRVPCPVSCVCGGVLEAIVGLGDKELQRDDLAPPELVCKSCGESTTFADAQSKSDSKRWVTEEVAVLWAPMFGHRLLAGTLRVWVNRGHVRTQQQGSRIVYWLEDVERRFDRADEAA